MGVFVIQKKGTVMADKFVDAYNKRTGEKLPHRVPESHFGIFPNLRKTPQARATEARNAQADKATTQKEK